MSDDWTQHTDIGAVARAYKIEPVHDWGRTEATGILLSNGTGAMLSAMDDLPWLRWAWDVSGIRAPLTYQQRAFALIAGRLADPIAGVLVFWADDPAPVRDLFALMPA